MRRDLGGIPDEDLLLAARRDGELFGEFYRRHYPTLLRFLHARCGSPDVAHALTQETMAKGYVAVVERENKVRKPMAWIYRIAIGELGAWRRASAAQTPYADMLDMLPAIGDGVDEFLLRDELNAALALLLTDEDAALLVMVDAHGVKLKDAAAAVGLDYGLAIVRVQRARAKMRAGLS